MIRIVLSSLLVAVALVRAGSLGSPKVWVKATGKPVSMINSIHALPNGDLIFAGHFEQGASLDTADMKPLSGMVSSNFVGRVDAAGKVQWVKPIGPGLMVPQALTVDPQGNIHIGASLYCGSKFHRIGKDSVDGTHCAESWYVVKLNSVGELLWARDWISEAPGENRNGKLASISVGPDGAVYAAGSSSSEVVKTSPVEVEALQFVAKIDAEGNRVWKKLIRYDGDGGVTSIAAHPDGNVYVTGWFNTKIEFRKSSGTWDDSLLSVGNEDIFIASFTGDGVLRFTKRAGGPGKDIATRIAPDGSGIRLGGTLEGEGDLDNLKNPVWPNQLMVARLDGTGKTLAYRTADLHNVKVLAWSLSGTSTHLLVEAAGDYRYVRMETDRMVSSDLVSVLALRAPGDTTTVFHPETMALDPSGVPVISGEVLTDIPNGTLWDAVIAKWTEFSWVSIRKAPSISAGRRIIKREERDLLGRKVMTQSPAYLLKRGIALRF